MHTGARPARIYVSSSIPFDDTVVESMAYVSVRIRCASPQMLPTRLSIASPFGKGDSHAQSYQAGCPYKSPSQPAAR